MLEQTLPAGRYVIQAEATLRSTDTQNVSCSLREGVAEDLDTAAIQPSAAGARSSVVLMGAADYATQSTLRVFCFESPGDTVTLEDVKVGAIQVASLTSN